MPAAPALDNLNELSSTLISLYWVSVDNPPTEVPSKLYSTISPSPNPWFLIVTLS